ncbi:MAG: shikimate dehydrogenase [Lachnospiraceae bacterium]|nr:shikimate dehydrogenase [Lachnospiraceae bacterium]
MDEKVQIPVPQTQGMYALLGHPVAHSMSPAMHNRAFEELGIDAKYVLIDVEEDELPDVVLTLKDMGYCGWNITMPLKSAMVPYCDELSDAARLCGAVNTVVVRDGRLTGYTTDGQGYTDSLADPEAYMVGGDAKNVEAETVSGKILTILGCGGAARSIIVQAALDKAAGIHVCKRKNASFDEAVAFCWQVSEETGVPIDVVDMSTPQDLKWAIDDAQILTNATNVGMEGTDLMSPVPAEFLRSELLVSDIIYHPQMTQLLTDAKNAGAKIHSGKWMLLYQGAAAFKLWTGRQMQVEAVKNVFR